MTKTKEQMNAETAAIAERFFERMKASRRLGQVQEGTHRPPRQSVVHLLAGYGGGHNHSAPIGLQDEWRWKEDARRSEPRTIDLNMTPKFREEWNE